MVEEKNLLVGDIKKCTKMIDHKINSGNGGYFEMDEEIISYNTILYQIREGCYIDLNKLYLIQLLSQNFIPGSNWSKLLGSVMQTHPKEKGDLFVDEKTIRSYDEYLLENNFSKEENDFSKEIKKIKKI